MPEVTQTEMYASAGAGLSRSSPLGRILLPFLVGLVSWGVMAASGIPHPGYFAVGVAILFELGFWLLRRVTRNRRIRTMQSEQDNRHSEREAEFQARFDQAKKNGDFDRFEGDT